MDEPTPYFSIVLPTYNRAHLISEAIRSVISQTFANWELIIVDDGSKDNTSEVVKGFGEKRIRYIYQANAERSAARNNGIANSTGKFICFLDSDDYYLPQHLELLYNYILKKGEPVGFFVTDVVRNENGNMVEVPHQNADQFPNSVCYVLMGKQGIIPSRVSVHSSILKKMNFDINLKDVEDTDLWVRIAADYPLYQTGNVSVVYYLHEFNSTNLTNNPFANQLKGLEKIFSDKKLAQLIPSTIRNKKMSTCYYGIARFHLQRQNYWRMVFYIIKSVVQQPEWSGAKRKLYLIFSHSPLLRRFHNKAEKS